MQFSCSKNPEIYQNLSELFIEKRVNNQHFLIQ